MNKLSLPVKSSGGALRRGPVSLGDVNVGWTLVVGGVAFLGACSDILGLDEYNDSATTTAASTTSATGSGGSGGSVGGAGGCVSNYPQLVVDDGAESYWRLGETRGPTAINAVQRMAPAQYSENPAPTFGQPGVTACNTAVEFLDGSCLDAGNVHNFTDNAR